VAALAQLTRLTALSFKSALTYGAAELILAMPRLEQLSAKQLLIYGGSPDGGAGGAWPRIRPATAHGLIQVSLQTCDDPCQLLVLPTSVVKLSILNLQWTLPEGDDGGSGEDGRVCDLDDGAGFAWPPLKQAGLSATVCSYLDLVRRSSPLLHRTWASSLSRGERGIQLRCAPSALGPLVDALGPLNGPCLQHLQVRDRMPPHAMLPRLAPPTLVSGLRPLSHAPDACPW
jgi:hypothetical protein